MKIKKVIVFETESGDTFDSLDEAINHIAYTKFKYRYAGSELRASGEIIGAPTLFAWLWDNREDIKRIFELENSVNVDGQ